MTPCLWDTVLHAGHRQPLPLKNSLQLNTVISISHAQGATLLWISGCINMSSANLVLLYLTSQSRLEGAHNIHINKSRRPIVAWKPSGVHGCQASEPVAQSLPTIWNNHIKGSRIPVKYSGKYYWIIENPQRWWWHMLSLAGKEAITSLVPG